MRRWLVLGLLLVNAICVFGQVDSLKKCNTPLTFVVDFSTNQYKDNAVGISGINFRFKSYGLGIHFGQGQDALDPKENFSQREKDTMTNKNLQGWFVDLHYYFDVKPLYLSFYPMIGFGALTGEQLLHVGYIDVYPMPASYSYGFVYGAGIQFHPWNGLIVGMKWNSMNRFSLQIGYGICDMLTTTPIIEYFKH